MIVRKQIIVGIALLSLSLNANAQFEVKDNSSMGTKVETIDGRMKRFTVDFNTDSELWKGIQVKGVFAKVYDAAGASVTIPLEQGKSESLNGIGNPLHVTDAAGIQSKFGQAVGPVVGYFDIENNNQAYGIYSGKYKKVELAMSLALRGCNLASDPSFDIITLDPGNTGKSSSYKLLIGVDTRNELGGNDCAALESATSADNTDKWFVFENFYTTGAKGDKKTVNLAELIGYNYANLSYKTVYMFLYTMGTEGEIEDGKYEPIIALDNYTFTYKEPEWIEPGVTKVDMTIGYNDSVAVDALSGETTPLKFRIKDRDRGGSLIFRCNSTRKPLKSLRFNFPETGAIKAKDANGNYTIDVPYSYTPCEANGSQVIMTVAAPDAGTMVEDDLEVTIEVTLPTKGVTAFEDKLEVDNGIRFFMDMFVNRVNETSIDSYDANASFVYTTPGCVTVVNGSGDVVIYSLDGRKLKSVSSEVAAGGVSLPSGMYLISIGGKTSKIVIR